MATDVDAVYVNWGQPNARAIRCAAPAQLAPYTFAAGSMAPKVEAAVEFASQTGKPAAIGALSDLTNLIAGTAGTRITPDCANLDWW